MKKKKSNKKNTNNGKKLLIIGLIIVVIIIVAVIFVNQINKNGREYEIAKVENYNYFDLKKDDKTGVIDKEGRIVVNANYDDVKIPNPEKDVFVCYQGEDITILNNKQEEIFTEFNKVEAIRLKNIASDLMYEKSVLKYEKDGKYGLIDYEGKKITEPIYEELDSLQYKEGELLVKKDDKYGVINIKGYVLVKIKYDQIAIDNYYDEEQNYKLAGYIVSEKTEEGYRYGYVNNQGEEKIKPEFNELSRVTEIEDNNTPYFILAKNGQYGVYKNEDSIIPNEYQSIFYEANNNVFVVEKTKKYGAINENGEVIIPVSYSQINITGKYLYAQNDQGTTVFDKNGKEANIDVNTAVIETSNSNYQIKIDMGNGSVYGILNGSGDVIVEPQYSYIEYLYENYFIASNKNGKLGVIDDSGNVMVNLQYDSIQKIQDTSMIQTTKSSDKSTSIYSSKMEELCIMTGATIRVKDTYVVIYNSNDRKYFSKTNNKEMTGKEVFTSNQYIANKVNNKWGFVDRSGETKIEATYDFVTEFNKYGYAGIKKGNKWGIINSQGEIIKEPTYELTDNNPTFIGEYYQIEYGYGEVYYTNV